MIYEFCFSLCFVVSLITSCVISIASLYKNFVDIYGLRKKKMDFAASFSWRTRDSLKFHANDGTLFMLRRNVRTFIAHQKLFFWIHKLFWKISNLHCKENASAEVSRKMLEEKSLLGESFHQPNYVKIPNKIFPFSANKKK